MSIAKWGWLLVLPILLAGCGSTPLTGDEEEVPPNFFFQYLTENSQDVSAGTGETPAPPEGAQPVDPAGGTDEKPAAAGAPSRLEVSVDVDGVVEYEAHYLSPKPARKEGQAKLDREALLRVVNALRAAKPFKLNDVYEGDDETLGKTTYEIIALNLQKRIVVDGTRLPEMEAVRKVILEEVTGEKILEYPEQGKDLIVMDIRTNEFHHYDSPRVQEIPIELRRQYNSQTNALNAGGWPAKEFDLQK